MSNIITPKAKREVKALSPEDIAILRRLAEIKPAKSEKAKAA